MMSHAVGAPPGHQAQIVAEFSDEPRGMCLPCFVNCCGIKRVVIFFILYFSLNLASQHVMWAACASKAILVLALSVLQVLCLPTLQSPVGFVFMLTN
jgi:hypothetical protein